MRPWNIIPKGFKVSMLVVLVDESNEDIQTKLANELEKNKIYRSDIINIESNFSHLESEHGYIKLVVWYMEGSTIAYL